MPQKVVTVNVLTRTEQKFTELEYPILNKYLEDGYKVVNTYQIAPSQQIYVVTITFILEKD